jgi:hypothetical protein
MFRTVFPERDASSSIVIVEPASSGAGDSIDVTAPPVDMAAG